MSIPSWLSLPAVQTTSYVLYAPVPVTHLLKFSPKPQKLIRSWSPHIPLPLRRELLQHLAVIMGEWYHVTETPLLLSASGIAHRPSTSFETTSSHRMQGLGLTLISDPMNGLSNQGWNTYEPGGTAVKFGRDGMLVEVVGLMSGEMWVMVMDRVLVQHPLSWISELIMEQCGCC